MKFNLKNQPKYPHSIGYDKKADEWFEGFFLQTIPRLLKRLDSYKTSIPVDIALQIVREELLGE